MDNVHHLLIANKSRFCKSIRDYVQLDGFRWMTDNQYVHKYSHVSELLASISSARKPTRDPRELKQLSTIHRKIKREIVRRRWITTKGSTLFPYFFLFVFLLRSSPTHRGHEPVNINIKALERERESGCRRNWMLGAIVWHNSLLLPLLQFRTGSSSGILPPSSEFLRPFSK